MKPTYAELEARVIALEGAIASLPTALYECDNISVIGDGCCSRSRDTWLINHCIRKHMKKTLSPAGTQEKPLPYIQTSNPADVLAWLEENAPQQHAYDAPTDFNED